MRRDLRMGAYLLAAFLIMFGSRAGWAQEANPDQKDQPQMQSPQEPTPSPDQAGHEEHREGAIPRQAAVLGVTVAPQSEGQGIRVIFVQPNGPAAQAGLREGDVIMEINNDKIQSGRELGERISRMRPGEKIALHFRRANEDKTASATLVAAPSMPGFAPSGPMFGQPGGFRENEAWMGVFLEPQAGEGRQGIRITQVHPAGPAARAGLRPGDLIVKIGDRNITSPDEVRNFIREKHPNDQITVVVRREGQDRTLNVALGSTEQTLRQDQMFGQGMGPGGMMPGMGPGGMQPGMGPGGMQTGMVTPQQVHQTLQDLVREVQELRREVRELRSQRETPGTAHREGETR